MSFQTAGWLIALLGCIAGWHLKTLVVSWKIIRHIDQMKREAIAEREQREVDDHCHGKNVVVPLAIPVSAKNEYWELVETVDGFEDVKIRDCKHCGDNLCLNCWCD
jgi:hypothetical protein